jgi:hypothetical protein
LLYGRFTRSSKGYPLGPSFGIDLEDNSGWDYVPVYQTYTPGGALAGQNVERSSLYFMRDSMYHWTWDNFFTYDKVFDNKQVLKVILGHTAERQNGWSNSATALNVPNNQTTGSVILRITSGGQQNIRVPINTLFPKGILFIRANYTLNDRYLINLTFREMPAVIFRHQKDGPIFLQQVSVGSFLTNRLWQHRKHLIFETKSQLWLGR